MKNKIDIKRQTLSETILKSNCYLHKTAFFLIDDNLIYILALLNFNFLFYTYKNRYSGASLDNQGYQYNKHVLVKFSISQLSESQQKHCETLAYYILFFKEQRKDDKTFYFKQIVFILNR